MNVSGCLSMLRFGVGWRTGRLVAQDRIQGAPQTLPVSLGDQEDGPCRTHALVRQPNAPHALPNATNLRAMTNWRRTVLPVFEGAFMSKMANVNLDRDCRRLTRKL